MYDKSVALGSRLHYPITITKLLKAPGDNIRRQESIIEYKFAWRRKITDQDTGEDRWTDEVTYTEFDSPAEGTLKGWRIKEGQEIHADMHAMTIEEACSHEVQIQGLCSLCGQDMTETNWASEGRETDRAMINMTHDQTGLMVSENVATKAEHDAQKRLLKQRKLSLVVDLDQTIIHACIEPTIGEWQRDPENPNHGAVKDVRSFQLDDGPSRGPASGCTYYIKLRPGLKEFLEEVAEKYELHVYTMGTRAYALNIAKIVDPDSRLFGNRVISRDENGSITAKSLQRLFPVSTNMVVIIDDRADVWPMNRPNLIKVVPYDFFKGIGDINSSFLPKRTDIVPAKTNGTPKVAPKPADPSVTEGAKPSPMDELAKMSETDEKALKSQTEEQEKTLEKQLTDRPLLHMQEELDKEEEEQSAEEASPGHHRQNLLVDDDEELVALQDHLNDLHTSFYDTYDQKRKSRPESHSQHRRKSVSDGVDLSMVPDVGDILDELKQNVLEGLVIALSGLVPIGIKVEESDIGVQAQSFGAQVLDAVSKRVTHLVVSSERPRTKKVQQAAKLPSIKIVNQNWLTDCLSQWRRLDEGPYYIDIMESDRAPMEDVSEPVSEFEEDDVKDLKDLDWEAADKEMEEFLGSDDDLDSDADTAMVSEAESQMDGGGGGLATKKRKKTEVNTDGESETESVLAKKQRVARNRPGSALRSAQAANGDDDEESSLPTPGPTTGDEDQSQQAQDDFEDDLERELLAELEAAEA